MFPIARVNDPHSCPMSVPTAHGGGVIQGSGSSVVVGHRPVALVGAPCSCGMPGAFVSSGSGAVTIDHRPAARVGSQTTHGGTVVAGDGAVLIP